MHEIEYGYVGNLLRDNRRSSRCGNTAMIRLLRSDDNRYYVAEHMIDHNHRVIVIRMGLEGNLRGAWLCLTCCGRDGIYG